MEGWLRERWKQDTTTFTLILSQRRRRVFYRDDGYATRRAWTIRLSNCSMRAFPKLFGKKKNSSMLRRRHAPEYSHLALLETEAVRGSVMRSFYYASMYLQLRKMVANYVSSYGGAFWTRIGNKQSMLL